MSVSRFIFWCPVVPASFIEKSILSVWNCLCSSVKGQLAVLVICVSLSGALYFVSLILLCSCTSVLS